VGSLVGRAITLLAAVATAFPAQVGAQSEVHSDVVYGHVDGMATVYDVARPDASANGAGVIFLISGGFLSTLEQQALIAPVAEPLLAAGFTVFYLRHPSTPRYLAPEIYESVRQGREHILEHAGDFGVDPRRIGVMGMSTGGLLALLLGLDPPAGTSSTRGERPAALVAYMPLADMRTAVGNVRATPAVGFAAELAPSLSPVDFITPDDPPTLLIHGVDDEILPIEENSHRLRRMLDGAGVPTDLVEVPAGHELFTGEVKARADRAVVRWFERHLLD
jgi:acetyl esterase/lipase